MQRQLFQDIPTGLRQVLLLAAASVLAPLTAQAACPEGGPTTTKNEFRRSQAVVMGHVIETVNHAAAGDPGVIESTDYTFKVDRQLKGKRVRTLVIHAKNTADRFAMNEQRRYLLFVSQGKDNKWFVDRCGNSALMARPVKKPNAAGSQR